MRLRDLLVRTADAALDLQRSDGTFPPGRNGPYDDPETPVRNTAHWTITLGKAFEITADQRYLTAIRRAAEYLLQEDARPMGATYLCRTNPLKDFSNGLIGQAWVIEGLVAATQALDDDRCRDTAREIFQLHPFDEQRGLWQRVNVDGSLGTIDNTFNHQLWFAAVGSMIDPDPNGDIGSKVVRFLDGTLGGSLRLHRTGRVRQAVGPDPPLARSKGLARTLMTPLASRRHSRSLAEKEIGYHSFNLYGFAMLYRSLPERRLWSSPAFDRLLKFVHSAEFESSITNPFGGPYNPVGLEAAYAFETFDGFSGLDAATVGVWVRRQLDLSWDSATGLMTRNTADPDTLAARIYEVTRLADLTIDVGER